MKTISYFSRMYKNGSRTLSRVVNNDGLIRETSIGMMDCRVTCFTSTEFRPTEITDMWAGWQKVDKDEYSNAYLKAIAFVTEQNKE